MKFDEKLVKKLLYLCEKYKTIALYGTGNVANDIWEYIKAYGLEDSVYCFVDRGESENIGTRFHGFSIKRLEDVIESIDAILVLSARYFDIIEERVKRVLEDYNFVLPIISIYDIRPQKIHDNSPEDYQAYVAYLEERQNNKQDCFVPITTTPYVKKRGDSKVIAYYLPQYYRMEINDKYHGTGFTEWTNSSQAIPLYVGHEQPHIPYDLGYYDLSNLYTLKRQVELANMYGVYGFCFHYYWFSGQRTMEKPLYMLLEHKEIPINYCIHWATENWTTTWDGGRFDVIFEQDFKEGDAEKFVADIVPFFRDERYIRIDGKPVLMIYEIQTLGENRLKEILVSLRKVLREYGIQGLYVMLSNHSGMEICPEEYDADAIVEFAPSRATGCCKYEVKGYLNPYYAGDVWDYKRMVREKLYMVSYATSKYYRSAMAGFDNTARKSKWGGSIYHGATPLLFGEWLCNIMRESHDIHGEDDIVFVNSWNEWAEGSHLEPDVRNGYGYLEAVKQAIYESRQLDTEYVRQSAECYSSSEELFFYVNCIESMGDIVACEPIARYLKEVYPESQIVWLVRQQYKAVIEFNPYIDEIIEVDCLSSADEICKDVQGIVVDCHYDGRRSSITGEIHRNLVNPAINEKTYFNYGAILENFSLTAGLNRLNKAPIFYLDADRKNMCDELGKYVVVHCKSAEEMKDWQQKKWNELAEHIMECGCQVVEIGLETVVDSCESNYHDMTSVHDLQAIAAMIRGAAFFIGVDSGFAHIANCFQKRSLILLGKYKNFKKYNPYTGFFAEHAEEVIVYPREMGASVKAIQVDEVMKRLATYGIGTREGEIRE